MKVLIIGGTGNISTSITEQLLAKGDVEIVHFNRGNRENPAGVKTIVGDRKDFARFEQQMDAAGYFDCVIDMIGFEPEDVESALCAFRDNTGHSSLFLNKKTFH